MKETYYKVKNVESIDLCDERAWIIDTNYRLFLSYNLSNWTLEKAIKFPDEVKNYNSFSGIKEYGNHLFFIPRYEQNIFIYDYIKNDYIKIHPAFFDNEMVIERNGRKEIRAVIKEGIIYLISRAPDVICAIDTISLDYYEQDISRHQYYDAFFSGGNFFSDTSGEELIIPFKRDFLVYYNIKSKQYYAKHLIDICGKDDYLEEKDDSLFGIRANDRVKVIYTVQGRIFLDFAKKWHIIDLRNYNLNSIDGISNWNGEKRFISNVFVFGEYLLVTFQYMTGILKMDIKSNEFTYYSNPYFYDYEEISRSYVMTEKYDSHIILLNASGSMNYIFDMKMCKFAELEFLVGVKQLSALVPLEEMIVNEADYTDNGLRALMEIIC